MFPREVCYHNDPSRVYDCTGWDSKSGLYRLTNDDGDAINVPSSAFTPVSAANEELVEFTKDGRMVTVSEQEAPFSFIGTNPETQVKKPAPKKSSSRTKAKISLDPDKVNKVKREIADMLSSCNNDRDEMAKIAGEVTGDHGPDLVLKYKHLDNGRFRMVLGNKMRSQMLKDAG